MMIKVKKLQMSTGQSVRYYLNGLTGYPLRAKFWVEKGDGDNLILRVIDAHGVKLQQVLMEMLESGQITQQEFDSPTIEMFDRLSGSAPTPSAVETKAASEPPPVRVSESSSRLTLSRNVSSTDKISKDRINVSSRPSSVAPIIISKKNLNKKSKILATRAIIPPESDAQSRAPDVIKEKEQKPQATNTSVSEVDVLVSHAKQENEPVLVGTPKQDQLKAVVVPSEVATEPVPSLEKEKPKEKPDAKTKTDTKTKVKVKDKARTSKQQAEYKQVDLDVMLSESELNVPKPVSDALKSKTDAGLMLAKKSVELPKPVTIAIANRSPKIIFDSFNAISGVLIEKRQIAFGDFAFDNGVVVRLSAQDLTNVIVDRDLLGLGNSLLAVKGLRIVILEGDVYSIGKLSANKIDRAVAYLSELNGVTVIKSESLQRTASVVAKIIFNATYKNRNKVSYD